MVRFDFRLELIPRVCPQGCSGRSCTAWRSWLASWRSGTATRSPAPTTSRGRAARSPARPGPLALQSFRLQTALRDGRGWGDLGHCHARTALGWVQLFAPLVLHLSCAMVPDPALVHGSKSLWLPDGCSALLVHWLRATQGGTILAGPGAPLCLCVTIPTQHGDRAIPDPHLGLKHNPQLGSEQPRDPGPR